METMYAEVKGAIEKVHETWVKKSAEIIKFRPKGVTAASDLQAQRTDAATAYFCQLLLDLVVYLDCRLKLVDLRLTLHKKALEVTPTSHRQALAVLEGILTHLPKLNHQLLAQLCQNMCVEVTIYQKLLQTELCIANYDVQAAMFNFTSLDVELQSMKNKFTFLKDKTESSAFLDTSLFHWYLSFKNGLFAKMNLLFAEFRNLHRQAKTAPEEPFAQEAGAELILHEKIMEFATQTGCYNVSLVLIPADGKGNGKSSWVPVFTFPQADAPLDHWPNLIMLYQDNTEYLDAAFATTSSVVPLHKSISGGIGTSIHHSSSSSISSISSSSTSTQQNDPSKIPLAILHYYDTHVDTTYYLAMLQPKMLLVVIFKGERQEDDEEVTGFMKGLFAKLRHSHLLQKVLSRRVSGSSTPDRSSSPKVPPTHSAPTESSK
jgi:hypothetical protein